MNFLKTVIIALFASLMFISCSQNDFRISGNIKNANNLAIELNDVRSTPQNTLAIGKTTSDGSGNFEIKVPESLPAGIYVLKIGVKYILLITNGKENDIKVNGDLAKIENLDYTVEGSEGTTTFTTTMRDLIASKITPDDAKNIALNTKNPLVGMMICNNIFRGLEFADTHRKMCDKVTSAYPESPFSKDYQNMVAQLEQALAQQTIKVGQPAPEITQPTPDGKMLSLSSLKGKTVLIDFWASWCGPCRRANPHVVELYNRYKDKGFTVFSVSLDDNEGAWKNAIATDKLIWENHVSDLKKWNAAPAKAYGVSSIPQAFLIDSQGNIAAILPPGMDPEPEIKKLIP